MAGGCTRRTTWPVSGGHARPCWPRAPTSGGHGVCDDGDMPLPRALARETQHVQLSHAEKKKLSKLARDAGLSPSNYFRSLIGLPERSPGRPTIEQLEREQDQA